MHLLYIDKANSSSRGGLAKVILLAFHKKVGYHIQICEHFNHIKPTNKNIWLYQPQCISPWPWESISLDYINDIPTTQWNNYCIFLLIFSKLVLFIPSKELIDAPTLTRLFLQHIWRERLSFLIMVLIFLVTFGNTYGI